jgi:hypothetical protein
MNMNLLAKLAEIDTPDGHHMFEEFGVYEKLYRMLLLKLFPERREELLKDDYRFSDGLDVHYTDTNGEQNVNEPEVFFQDRYLPGYFEEGNLFTMAFRSLNPFYDDEGRVYNPFDETMDYDEMCECLENCNPQQLAEEAAPELAKFLSYNDELCLKFKDYIDNDPYHESSTIVWVSYESKELGYLLNAKRKDMLSDPLYKKARKLLFVLENPFSSSNVIKQVCPDGIYRLVLFMEDWNDGYSHSDDEVSVRLDYLASSWELEKTLAKLKRKYPSAFGIKHTFKKEVKYGCLHAAA